MKVRYLKDVSSPSDQYGKKGEVRELDRDIATHLISGGYVEDVENPAPKAEPKAKNVLVEASKKKPKIK